MPDEQYSLQGLKPLSSGSPSADTDVLDDGYNLSGLKRKTEMLEIPKEAKGTIALPGIEVTAEPITGPIDLQAPDVQRQLQKMPQAPTTGAYAGGKVPEPTTKQEMGITAEQLGKAVGTGGKNLLDVGPIGPSGETLQRFAFRKLLQEPGEAAQSSVEKIQALGRSTPESIGYDLLNAGTGAVELTMSPANVALAPAQPFIDYTAKSFGTDAQALTKALGGKKRAQEIATEIGKTVGSTLASIGVIGGADLAGTNGKAPTLDPNRFRELTPSVLSQVVSGIHEKTTNAVRNALSKELSVQYTPEEIRSVYEKVKDGSASQSQMALFRLLEKTYRGRSEEVAGRGVDLSSSREYHPLTPQWLRNIFGEFPKSYEMRLGPEQRPKAEEIQFEEPGTEGQPAPGQAQTPHPYAEHIVNIVSGVDPELGNVAKDILTPEPARPPIDENILAEIDKQYPKTSKAIRTKISQGEALTPGENNLVNITQKNAEANQIPRGLMENKLIMGGEDRDFIHKLSQTELYNLFKQKRLDIPDRSTEALTAIPKSRLQEMVTSGEITQKQMDDALAVGEDIPNKKFVEELRKKGMIPELRPAVRTDEGFIAGNPGETHDDIEKFTPTKGERGFVTPKNEFLDRTQAVDWLKKNSPSVHKRIAEAGITELHTQDYNAAVQGKKIKPKTPQETLTQPQKPLSYQEKVTATFIEGLSNSQRLLTDESLRKDVESLIGEKLDINNINLRDIKRKSEEIVRRRINIEPKTTPETPAPAQEQPSVESKPFYKNTIEGFQKIDAKPTNISGFENYEFFTHKESNGYNVTEGRSGQMVGHGKTRKDAIDNARELLTQHKDQLNEIIQKSIEKYGVSPRYSGESSYRYQLKSQLEEVAPQIPKEQVDTFFQIADARAETWAKQNNKTPEEWYKSRIGGFGKGEGLTGKELAQSLAPTFYSRTEKLLTDKLPNQANVEQVRNILKSAPQEEVKWTGLDDFLKGKTKVSKQEILDYLKANKVDVREIEKGGAESNVEVVQSRGANPVWQIREKSGDKRVIASGYETREQAEADIPQSVQFSGVNPQTKFSQYVLPGAKEGTYRELLLTLPTDATHQDIPTGYEIRFEGRGAHVLFYEGTFQGQFPTREGAIRKARLFHKGDKFPTSYSSPHFNEPNVLAHIRFNERTDAQGKRTLFLEEVQSDWAQEARRFGIQDVKNVPDAPFIRGRWKELAIRRMIRYSAENGFDSISWTTGEQQAERYDLSKQVDEVAYNPKEKILQGVKGKESVLSQSNVGETDLEKYVGKDVAKKLTEAEVGKDGWKSVRGDDLKVGGAGMSGFYDKELVNIANDIGKKFGVKVGKAGISYEELRSGEEPVPVGIRSIIQRLDNLGFNYIGQAAAAILEHEDFGERWDIPQSEATVLRKWRDDTLNQQVSVHSLEITPEMKRSVLEEGQPLFQGKKGAVQFADDGKAIIHAFESTDISTLVHELGHVFRRDLSEKDLKTVEDVYGVKDGNWEREHEERFARSFERYLREGKAPTPKLKGVFERFKDWLTNIYQKIKGSAIDVKLTDSIRDIFDRMLGGEEEPIEKVSPERSTWGQRKGDADVLYQDKGGLSADELKEQKKSEYKPTISEEKAKSVLEPLLDKARAEAQRRVQDGKVKMEKFSDEVRTVLNRQLRDTDAFKKAGVGDRALLYKAGRSITEGLKFERPEFQYVDTSPLDFQVSDKPKTAAEDIRYSYTGKFNEQKLRGNHEADNIKNLTKTPLQDSAVWWYRQMHGEEETIASALADTDPKLDPYRKELEAALNLTEDSKKALAIQNQFYDEGGKYSLMNGTIKNVVDDYANRIYAPQEEGDRVSEVGRKGVGTFTRHKLERKFDDPVEAIKAGFKPLTTKASENLSIWNEEMARVNTNAELARAMQEKGVGGYTNVGSVPKDFKPIDGLDKLIPTGKGDQQKIIHLQFSVPEKLYRGLRALFEPDRIKQIDFLRPIFEAQAITKIGKLAFSLFHDLSLAGQFLGQTKGGVDVALNLDSMNRLDSPEFKERERFAVRNGLITSKLETNQDIMRELMPRESVIGKAVQKAEQAPGVKQLIDLARWKTDFTFGKLQRWQKVNEFTIKAVNWLDKHPNAAQIDQKQAMRAISREVNASDGGLNWKALGTRPTVLTAMRFLTLAPDWWRSNVEMVNLAAKKGIAGKDARSYWATYLIGGMILTEGLSYLINHRFTDKNEKGHEFEVEISPGVYISIFRGAAGDAVKVYSMTTDNGVVAGSLRFGMGKLSPAVTTAIGIVPGMRKYTGERIIDERDSNGKQIMDAMKFVIENATPIPIGVGATKSYAEQQQHPSVLGTIVTSTGLGRATSGQGAREPWEKEMQKISRAKGFTDQTSEQRDVSQFKRQLIDKLKDGQNPNEDDVKRMRDLGLIDANEMPTKGFLQSLGERLAYTAQQRAFQRLSYKDAKRIYDMMPDDVAEQFKPFMLNKIMNAPEFQDQPEPADTSGVEQ